MGGKAVGIDFAPFSEAGRLLYDGPWVAERLAALETFVRMSGEAMHPITHQIITGGAVYSAVDTFRALDRLQHLRAQTSQVWARIDCLIVPTAPTVYRIDAVEADPLRSEYLLWGCTQISSICSIWRPLPCQVDFDRRGYPWASP